MIKSSGVIYKYTDYDEFLGKEVNGIISESRKPQRSRDSSKLKENKINYLIERIESFKKDVDNKISIEHLVKISNDLDCLKHIKGVIGRKEARMSSALGSRSISTLPIPPVPGKSLFQRIASFFSSLFSCLCCCKRDDAAD